jgi:GDPmannose 4,6-dehydratase
LGNLDARRDWGFAGDYVEAMWLMLQQPEPDDFVIATGESHSVREFVELAFREAGMHIVWRGKGTSEKGLDSSTGKVLVAVDPRYFRPAEVDSLLGDPSKAATHLNWRPRMRFADLIKLMVEADLKQTEQELYLKTGGFEVKDRHE